MDQFAQQVSDNDGVKDVSLGQLATEDEVEEIVGSDNSSREDDFSGWTPPEMNESEVNQTKPKVIEEKTNNLNNANPSDQLVDSEKDEKRQIKEFEKWIQDSLEAARKLDQKNSEQVQLAEKLKEELENLQKKNQELEETIAELKDTIAENEISLDAFADEMMEYKELKDSRAVKIKELEEKMNKLSSDYEVRKSELEEQKSEKEKLEKLNNTFQSEKDNLIKEIEKYKNEAQKEIEKRNLYEKSLKQIAEPLIKTGIVNPEPAVLEKALDNISKKEEVSNSIFPKSEDYKKYQEKINKVMEELKPAANSEEEKEAPADQKISIAIN